MASEYREVIAGGSLRGVMSRCRQVALVAVLLAVAVSGCSDDEDAPARRVLVLGIDGMDFGLVTRLMEEGKMPAFSRLAGKGQFQRLETSFPPLSPVAWSDFITGSDAGHHGIFDFLHRSPDALVPTFAMATTEEPGRWIGLGGWRLPLGGGSTRNMRLGRPFWEPMTDSGVDTTIVRMPANYPPSGVADRELSGMGTPDLLGTYGTFTYITTDLGYPQHSPDSGRVVKARLEQGRATVALAGPANPLRSPDAGTPPMTVPLRLTRGPDGHTLEFDLDGRNFTLAEGEWSYWVPLSFQPLPAPLSTLLTVDGMVRFYLRRVNPHVELYMSPVNQDPLLADSGVASPGEFAVELARETGRYYTQGMPEDTKALEAGILELDEFLEQAAHARDEVLAQLPSLAEELRQGSRSLLFYYTGYLDQLSHMLWGRDPEPGVAPEKHPDMIVERAYRDMDALVGKLHKQLGDEVGLVVMSDHGFATWEREFDLNAWLLEQGYLALRPGYSGSTEMLAAVDWSRTRAYGVGFNGLYINRQYREAEGVVTEDEAQPLLEELEQELLALRDPASGRRAISRIARRNNYTDGPGRHRAPDLILGYRKGTRVSSLSALGGVGNPATGFTDHDGGWSGDHAMDPEAVPGLLLTSFPLAGEVVGLGDLAAVLLREMHVDLDSAQ